jgi:multidrug resistance efflux pump
MKNLKFNILYLVVPCAIYAIFGIYKAFDVSGESFMGLAANLETQVSTDNPIIIEKLFVTPGSIIKKGDTLIEGSRITLDQKIQIYDADIKTTNAATEQEVSNLETKMIFLKSDVEEKTNALNAKIKEIENQRNVSIAITKDIKSVDLNASKLTNSYDIQIANLKDQINLMSQNTESNIRQLQIQKSTLKNNNRAQLDKINSQVRIVNSDKKRLVIVSQIDGIVGNVSCKYKENIEQFKPMLTLLEKAPTKVIAYINENYAAALNLGDSVKVSAFLNPKKKYNGKIMALGHRIIELPSRFWKIPNTQVYGREVIISLQPDNDFLHNEKVNVAPINLSNNYFSLIK